ncbi:MAG: RuvA C-terminal domain-containing protein [Bacillota bacterium]|nr:RuvA C-terminal domain-containing protein [Bacillota bacterium]
MNTEQENKNHSIKALLCDEPWSNSACCGYVMFAAKSLGYSKEQIRELISALNAAFGNHTVEEVKHNYEHNFGTY